MWEILTFGPSFILLFASNTTLHSSSLCAWCSGPHCYWSAWIIYYVFISNIDQDDHDAEEVFHSWNSNLGQVPRHAKSRNGHLSGSQGLWIQKWRLNIWMSLWIGWTVLSSSVWLPGLWNSSAKLVHSTNTATNPVTMAKHKSTSHLRR